ncbi:hypothetical protein DIPPA_20942 [Diplonema papillatum]|nr:hypothetical protein DIPPA_20942 [Diplonema papillatum]
MSTGLRFAVLAASLLLPLADAHAEENEKFTNYNSVFVSYPKKIYEPWTRQQIQAIAKSARKAGKRVHVAGGGNGHTWGGIGQCDDDQYVIDMRRFDKIGRPNRRLKQVTVETGVLLHDLAVKLDE